MIVSVDSQIALLSFKENLPPPTMVLWFSGSVLVFGFNCSLNSTKLHSYSGAKQILAGAINKQNKGFYVPLAGNRKEKDNYDLPFTTSSRSSIARRTTQKLWTMSNYINIFSISPLGVFFWLYNIKEDYKFPIPSQGHLWWANKINLYGKLSSRGFTHSTNKLQRNRE